MKARRVLCIAVLSAVLAFAAISQAADVKIRVAGFGGTDTAIVEELIARFVQPNLKGIQVTYEPIPDAYDKWIINALSAGTGPDLFYVDIFWSQGLFSSGAVEPLDTYLAKSKVLQAKDIIPALLNGFTYKGKVYGIPKDFNTLAVIYNKDMFDIAKVPYPDKNDDWNTFTAKLQKVQAAFPGVYGVCLSPEFARMGAFAYATGFKNFDKDGKTNLLSKEFRDAFNWYTGLADKGIGVMPADIGQGWGGGALASEQVACCFEGAWVLGFLRDESPNLNYGATMLPKYPGTGQRGNLMFTVSWSMNAASKHKEEAFKVLEMLTSPEAQQWVLERGLALPSRRALINNPYFQKTDREALANRVVFEGSADGYVMPFEFGQYGGDWMMPINQALTSVMSGQQTADEALREAQQRLNELIGK
jgi:multiple sugar transport system substrate-binding protein